MESALTLCLGLTMLLVALRLHFHLHAFLALLLMVLQDTQLLLFLMISCLWQLVKRARMLALLRA